MELQRLILLSIVAAGLVLAIVIARTWAARHRSQVSAAPVGQLWAALGASPDDRPTFVAFSSPACSACHTAQAPALWHLQQQLGETAVRVLQVDVATQPAAARAFGIVTVPSTVLLERDGVRAINHGFRPAQRLADQLVHRA
jgi:thiol-disulfide isomerase/thioredoxin